MRPRALLNAIAYIRGTAVNRGHGIIQSDDVITGLRTHSHDLVEEISLEIRDVAPEIENAVYLLLEAPGRISRDDLLYLFVGGGIEDVHWNKLIDLFLWYGILGIERQDGGATYIYSVSYNFAMLQATTRKAGEGLVFVVNPAFSLALGREEDALAQPSLFH
jgi:hypothetical protein